MNVFEMLSFDFMEFVTSPEGIFIIVGILLLIVGVVMLAMEKGKNKDGNVSVPTQEANNTPPVIPTATEAPVVPTAGPVVIPTVTEAPTATTIEATVAPVVTETPVMPTVESIATPVAEPVIVSNTETTVAPVEKVEETVTVYGGASPEVVNKEILEEKPREIYGGANPLENTAPIPTQSVNAAYSATPAPTAEVQATPAPVMENIVSPTETPVVANAEPVTVTAAPEQPKEEIEKLEF